MATDGTRPDVYIVRALVQGEMQGRPVYDNTLIGARAWEPEVLPRWHDVNDDDIGFLRARLARLQAHVATTAVHCHHGTVRPAPLGPTRRSVIAAPGEPRFPGARGVVYIVSR